MITTMDNIWSLVIVFWNIVLVCALIKSWPNINSYLRNKAALPLKLAEIESEKAQLQTLIKSSELERKKALIPTEAELLKLKSEAQLEIQQMKEQCESDIKNLREQALLNIPAYADLLIKERSKKLDLAEIEAAIRLFGAVCQMKGNDYRKRIL